MRSSFLLLVLLLGASSACAQPITVLATPPPYALSDSLTFVFDATRGDAGLATYLGDVYAYTGVLTPASTSLTDWKHVQGPYVTTLTRLRLKPLGAHQYRFRIRPDTFYGLAAGEQVTYFTFVFHSADGAQSGRDVGGADIVVPFYSRTNTVRNYASHQWANNLLTITASDGATLTVQPYAAGVARMGFYPSGTAATPRPSFAVNATAAGSGTLTDASNKLTLALSGLTVVVQKTPLRLAYLRGTDTLLAEAPGYFEAGSRRGVRFNLKNEEALYGTGSRAVPINRRGQLVQLYNQAHYGFRNGQTDLNISIPLVLSGRGYGVFFDDERPGYLDLGRLDPSALEYGSEGDRLGYFVLAQSTLPDLLATYTNLTGHQPMPPRWAMGYIQSKFGYQNETEARTIVNQMRSDNFPLSGLVLDLYWFGNANTMGNLNWDRARFPNPTGMMADFNNLGIKTVLITEPYFTQQSTNYATLASNNYLARTSTGTPYVLGNFWAGSAGLLDMSNTSVREWMWPFYKARALEGVGGWWSDLGEPESHPDDMVHAGGTARTVHNIFSHQWEEMLATHYQQEFPTQRLFNLTRSGYAGMQRLGATPWSGDVERSWSGLQAQIPVMLGMGLSGEGYTHSDAGGFTGGPQNNELYVRWLQYAAFTPLMRVHNDGSVPAEPVNYPDPYKSIIRDYAHLRHQLLPYNYSLAWENSQTGIPLARPLNFTAAAGTGTTPANLDDAYHWGNDLLVAPILNAGQTQRTLALPAGGPWLDYWTTAQYAGGSTATLAAPLTRLPLLVRGGAMLPMLPYRASTAQGKLDTLQVSYFPAPGVAGTASTVYDDDGQTPNAYAQNQYQLLHFQDVSTTAGILKLVATATGPGYASAPRRRVVEYAVRRVAAAPGSVTYQSQALPLAATAAAYQASPDSAAYYDDTAKVLLVRFRWRHQPTTVQVMNTVLATASPAAPAAIGLNAPYPNPFTERTTLSYDVAKPGTYSLHVYTVTGQLVATLPVVAPTPGAGQVVWEGKDAQGRPLPAGIYLLELNGQHQQVVRL